MGQSRRSPLDSGHKRPLPKEVIIIAPLLGVCPVTDVGQHAGLLWAARVPTNACRACSLCQVLSQNELSESHFHPTWATLPSPFERGG